MSQPAWNQSDDEGESEDGSFIQCHSSILVRSVDHVQQKYDWDCGVAAVAMCLSSTQKEDLFANLQFFRFNDQTGFDNSTWTIDLCYILSYFDIKCTIYTSVLGVNPDLKKEEFYSEVVDRDTARVSRLFQESEKHGITAVKQILQIETLIELLRTTGPLIILVNANLLYCMECPCPWSFIQSCVPCRSSSSTYQGHYVLALGYDLNNRLIYYRNPGFTTRVCRMSFLNFDLARSAFGTDHDVISVHTERS